MTSSSGPVAADPPDHARLGAAGDLDDVEAIARRSRAANTALSAPPLIVWGLEWVAVYALLDLVALRWAVPIAVALGIASVLASMLTRSREVRSGYERQLAIGWWALMLASPFIVLIARPESFRTGAILLGVLFALGMLLTGIALRDRALCSVGAVAVVVGAAVQALAGRHATLWFGGVSGAVMIALGLVRLRGRA